jgi:hypothetical protein
MPEGWWRRKAWPTRELDAIARHRLGMMDLSAETLRPHPVADRLTTLYARFLERIPYENLSNNRACLEAPDDPTAWPRATDRCLRENRKRGFGGTSFSLAYTLRDLFCGVGANAHCTMGRNLVTEEMHAAVVVYLDCEPVLYDPAMLACGPIPVCPGGELKDPLGTLRFEAHRGASLTLTLTLTGTDRSRALYTIVPVPAPPHRFRQAWVASFCRGRCAPLRMARRVGDEIRRYSERPQRLEVLTTRGKEDRRLDPAPVEDLYSLFGIDRQCLQSWFADEQRYAV